MRNCYRKIDLKCGRNGNHSQVQGIICILGTLAFTVTIPLWLHNLFPHEQTPNSAIVTEFEQPLQSSVIHQTILKSNEAKPDLPNPEEHAFICSTPEFPHQADEHSQFKKLINPSSLATVIQNSHSKFFFYDRFKSIYTNKLIPKLLETSPEDRNIIKSLLSHAAENDEGTIASYVEWSNLGLESRSIRQQASIPSAKIGFFAYFFKKIFACVYGKDIIDEAIEYSRSNRQVYQRLRNLGFSEEQFKTLDKKNLEKFSNITLYPLPGIPIRLPSPMLHQ